MARSILIADDDPDVVELLSRRCLSLGLEVHAVNNAISALDKADEIVPDVAILDVDMPYGNGLSVCEMMADHAHLKDMPIIMLTSSSGEQTIRRCHQMCAYYVLKCPDVWPRIEPLLREILSIGSDRDNERMNCETLHAGEGATQMQSDFIDTLFAVIGVEQGDLLADHEPGVPPEGVDAPWVLAIEDDDDFALALELRLQDLGIQVIRASAGHEGFRAAVRELPCAITLDYELPQGKGDYVLRQLKQSPATCDIPVIMLTGRRDASIERQMLSLGASEFHTKPLNWKKLRSSLRRIIDSRNCKDEIHAPQECLA